jgi:hypothetical protein
MQTIRRGVSIVSAIFGCLCALSLVHLISVLTDHTKLVSVHPSAPVAIAGLVSMMVGSLVLTVVAWPRRKRARTSG